MKIAFEDLNSLKGIQYIDNKFIEFLKSDNELLFKHFLSFRSSPELIDAAEYSNLLIKIAPILDDFLANLFDIEQENSVLRQQHKNFDIIYECKRKFVQRVIKKFTNADINKLNFHEIVIQIKELIGEITQEHLAKNILFWQTDEASYTNELEIASKYAAYMVYNNSTLELFDIPRPIEPENYIRTPKIKQLKTQQYLGFDYRDKEKLLDKGIAHAKYCIYCHIQRKDSCSKGIDFNQNKRGCPLKQKISEMNKVKSVGFNLAALAIIVIDNPLVAATGHRICNDCMKACIYQKQDPVNIPLIESNILEQVLSLPWGVEIYLLLTKWNPLNFFTSMLKNDSGYNILVTGLGPAGFALAYYLLNEGHHVIAIDGLKISPLHFDIDKPIKYWKDIVMPLSEKIPNGFGGVSEYGITNRWDKNNLTLIRLILERRDNFKMYGGIRLGSNITVDQAFGMGFDHLALCLGAGKPKFIKSKSYFASGIKSAADFLMSLQQGGAYLADSNSNLLIRLPAVVIGGGLTAIDSAVELLHYYPILVKKFLSSYESNKILRKDWNDEDKKIAEEFIAHAKLFCQAKDSKSKLQILNDLGGVTICYRNDIKLSPAYKLNPEEIEHAMSMGIKFKTNFIPKEITSNKFGYAESISFENNVVIKAKTIIVAIGTEKNEFIDINNIDNHNNSSDIFKSTDCKISYFGDCNQKYAGSVVKAIASAKQGFGTISKKLLESSPKYDGIFSQFKQFLDNKLISRIAKINTLSDNIIELIIHSPYAARNFRPGQFYRLQNFTTSKEKIIEPLALTGSDVDAEKGIISLIILEVGKSSSLCKNFTIGEEVILMGPTGSPIKIVQNKVVCLIGGGLGNAILLPIGKALKENGCKVIYFASYKKAEDRFYSEKIEAFSDIVIWCCDNVILNKNRCKDFSIKGNIIKALNEFKGKFSNFDQVICIGSDEMMETVAKEKITLFPNSEIICSINSPMQCMMKGICGQCIQKINDEKGYIFTCACQNQNSEIIDFKVLNNRLNQNYLLRL